MEMEIEVKRITSASCPWTRRYAPQKAEWAFRKESSSMRSGRDIDTTLPRLS